MDFQQSHEEVGMLNEYKILVTVFTNEDLTKDEIEQEISSLLTQGGGLMGDDSLDAHSVTVLLMEDAQ